ncbi:MAG: metal-dependent phosphohydrolase [Deltaproteobacteria bacterium RIFOXYD12_FULL_57_12]|nr:MAG: metal-dependent phosphohydrolase [Deltaproteobacteria bacterium RIFOXYD12_FULL_57_12]
METGSLTREQRFKRIQLYLDRMPSLSTTVSKVLQICDRPDTSPNDLNRIISLDPVLTGRVLKLINSAYYSLPNQITTLARAIIMLGINTVKNLALSTAVLGNMGNPTSFPQLPMDLFWTHSLCVGVTAKALATRKGIPPLMREEYFVAGLLHDLGKIPLANCFPEEYGLAFDRAAATQSPLFGFETELVEFDHGRVGGMISEKWKLSGNITAVLSHHHSIDGVEENQHNLVGIVALANIYANIYDIGSAGDRFQDETTVSQVLESIDMAWSDLFELEETIQEEIEKARIFLDISKGA